MDNTQITVGMIGTVPVGRNRVKVEIIAVNDDWVKVRNLNTHKESEVKSDRFTPETPTAATDGIPKAPAAPEKGKPVTVKVKKPGLLDKLAAILREEGKAMTTGELIEALKARNELTLTGKTPKQTLYSALYRAIQKGDERFEKVARNTFKHR